MFKRFLMFYNPFGLLILLGFLFSLNIYIFFENPFDLEIYVIVCSLIFFSSFLINENMLRSIKYIFSGNLKDLDDVFLSNEKIAIKKARNSKNKPLFVPCDNKYYYYDNNYN